MELIEAVRENNLDLVNQLLLNRQIDVNSTGNGETTALLVAAEMGYVEIGQRLIDSGANVNRGRPETNYTPLMAAAEKYHNNFVVLLLEQEGIDVNAVDTTVGNTALFGAITSFANALPQWRRPVAFEIIEMLLGSGADPNIINLNNQNALCYAIYGDDVDIVRLLVANGADINQRIYGRDKFTSLILAVDRERPKVTNYLLTLPNIEVDAVTGDGLTSLMIAAQFGYRSIVMQLIEAGADPLVRSLEGKTAREYSYDPIISELLQGSEDIWRTAQDDANQRFLQKLMVSRRLRTNETLPVRQLGDGIIQRVEYDQLCMGLQSNLTKPGVVALAKSLKIQTTRQTKLQLCREISKLLII